MAFPDKLILHTRHLHKHNEAGRKEKPGHSDNGQEVKSGQEQDDRQEVEVDGGQKVDDGLEIESGQQVEADGKQKVDCGQVDNK